MYHTLPFTDTRGVGKNTIARILAKSLNCEQSISSAPCGKYSVCTVKHNASAFILAHNHLSGITEPSHADRELTTRL
jgi:DNA polymerase III gamma/tau subunit